MTRTESTKSQVTPNFDLPVDKFSDVPGYFYSLDSEDQACIYSFYDSSDTHDLIISHLEIIYRTATRESIIRDYSYSSQLISATEPLTSHFHQRQS